MRRILVLDIIRFLAISLIFLHHYCKTIGVVNNYDLAAVIGIALFVFISGYLALAASTPDRRPLHWFLRKFFKILIPYWLIFHPLIVLNSILHFKHYNIHNYLFELLGLQLFIEPLYDATWFITYILILYLVIALSQLLKKLKLIILPAFLITTTYLIYQFTTFSYLKDNLFAWALCFFVGSVLGQRYKIRDFFYLSKKFTLTPLLEFSSRIGYTFYLIHGPILFSMNKLLTKQPELLFLISVSLTIIFANCVEKLASRINHYITFYWQATA